MLKILGVAIPMCASTFPQDFSQLIFQQGACAPLDPPLKLPMLSTRHFISLPHLKDLVNIFHQILRNNKSTYPYMNCLYHGMM